MDIPWQKKLCTCTPIPHSLWHEIPRWISRKGWHCRGKATKFRPKPFSVRTMIPPLQQGILKIMLVVQPKKFHFIWQQKCWLEPSVYFMWCLCKCKCECVVHSRLLLVCVLDLRTIMLRSVYAGILSFVNLNPMPEYCSLSLVTCWSYWHQRNKVLHMAQEVCGTMLTHANPYRNMCNCQIIFHLLTKRWYAAHPNDIAEAQWSAQQNQSS